MSTSEQLSGQAIDTAELPMEQLEMRIWQGAANMTAAECEWLLAVAEFDRREGWVPWECTSCAAWLSWQVNMDIRTAHEKVRVANALTRFPLICAEMAAGRLSYAKVRAISRIVAPDTEQMLVDLAIAGTAQQVERIVTGYRRSEDATETAEARQRERRRFGHTVEADGSVSIRIRLPADDAARVLAIVDDHLAAPARGDERVPLDQRRADAFVDAMTANGAGSEFVHGPDGGIVGVTSRQRLVRGAARKFIELRDGGCRFPGCNRRGHIEVHHIVQWSQGGDSDPDNVILLCRFHHHRVHDAGWELMERDGAVVMVGPRGRTITPEPPLQVAERGAIARHRRSANDGRCQWEGDRLDLGLITELLHQPRRWSA